ncbi:MAG TPA: right-handed parallel beta-helix repeat-containing protein [Gammaproteobacteria bacterium]|nr:right-handed parallel beta-helix repeat-containing protein [Gammaproteobacteria bacterium]
MFKRAILLPMLATFALISTVHAYSPPIGIPAPSFGIDEQAPAWPAQWPGAQVTNHYYLDNTHPQATDTNNPNGYPDKPRKTLPNGAFPAGTYMEINGGPYTNPMPSNRPPVFNCTAAKPCWLRGGSANAKTVFSGVDLKINDSQYLIVENLDLNGGAGGFNINGVNTHHISVRNSIVQNKPFISNTSAVNISAGFGGSVYDIVVYNMQFYKLGDWLTLIDQDYHGVGPNLWGRDSTATAYNIWILESTCVNISGNCIQVNAGNWPDSYKYLHHIYIGRNNSHDNRQSAYWSKQASDVIISENNAYGGRRHGPQPGDGIGFQYGPNNLWIIYNNIYDSNYGIRQSDTSDPKSNSNTAYIVGNVIHDIHPGPNSSYTPDDAWRPGQAIALWHGNMTRYIVDNTIYNVHGGVTAIYNGPVHMSGNLISGINQNDYYIFIEHPARNGVVSIDYSLLDDPEGDTRIRWNWQTYSGIQSFQAATNQCSNCIPGDPRFTNAAATFSDPANPLNLTIGSDSSAIGKNNNLNSNSNNTPNVYKIFKDLYGLDIQRDLNGKTRPMAGRSIGAFEASNSAGGTIPATPPLDAPTMRTPQKL